MNDCIFCKIVRGEVNSPRIYEDETVICIRDIRPQAKIHLLVIPKEHVASLEACFPQEGKSRAELVAKSLGSAVRAARQVGLLPEGFRTVINTNERGGQTVFHLHFHLLGGDHLSESMA